MSDDLGLGKAAQAFAGYRVAAVLGIAAIGVTALIVGPTWLAHVALFVLVLIALRLV
jgi:hypothetical protein